MPAVQVRFKGGLHSIAAADKLAASTGLSPRPLQAAHRALDLHVHDLRREFGSLLESVGGCTQDQDGVAKPDDEALGPDHCQKVS